MRWDVGTLKPNPSEHRSYQWMMRRWWFSKGFPEDVLEEIAIFWATPGLDNSWLCKNFKLHKEEVLRFRKKLPVYEDLKDKVIENWLSMTREDCRLMSRLRTKKVTPPLPCQLAMIDDMKAGMSQREVARQYQVDRTIVARVRNHGPSIYKTRWTIPDDFGRLFGIPRVPEGGSSIHRLRKNV